MSCGQTDRTLCASPWCYRPSTAVTTQVSRALFTTRSPPRSGLAFVRDPQHRAARPDEPARRFDRYDLRLIRCPGQTAGVEPLFWSFKCGASLTAPHSLRFDIESDIQR